VRWVPVPTRFQRAWSSGSWGGTVCWRAVGFADFWGHALVAEGAVDIMIEPILGIWDIAALRPIVEEAGGRISDLTGDGWAEGAPCVTTNGNVHDEVLDLMRAAT